MSAAVPLPDLLRRFVLTPYRFSAVAGSIVISFETNDQELLVGFRDRTEQLVSALKLPSHNTWHWKLVRDHDVSQTGHDAYLLSGETLSVIFLGMGTVVAIDWGKGEILGFIAANTPVKQLLDVLMDFRQRSHSGQDAGRVEMPLTLARRN